ncbi:hypothetical protein D3C87_1282650 [compost metagenome]
MRPGDRNGSGTNDRHAEKRQVQPADRTLNPRDRKVTDDLQHDRNNRYPAQPEPTVQPADQLRGNRHTGEQKGDGGLQVAPAPAERLFQRNHQGAEGVQQRSGNTGADAKQAQDNHAPAALELGKIIAGVGRGVAVACLSCHELTPIADVRVD